MMTSIVAMNIHVLSPLLGFGAAAGAASAAEGVVAIAAGVALVPAVSCAKAGAGPKLKQILQRGVGVHHAGVLPKYRRIVEDLFQQKLLSVCVCTETLSAGINLPARSVLLPTLLKGPPGDMKLIVPIDVSRITTQLSRLRAN